MIWRRTWRCPPAPIWTWTCSRGGRRAITNCQKISRPAARRASDARQQMVRQHLGRPASSAGVERACACVQQGRKASRRLQGLAGGRHAGACAHGWSEPAVSRTPVWTRYARPRHSQSRGSTRGLRKPRSAERRGVSGCEGDSREAPRGAR